VLRLDVSAVPLGDAPKENLLESLFPSLAKATVGCLASVREPVGFLTPEGFSNVLIGHPPSLASARRHEKFAFLRGKRTAGGAAQGELRYQACVAYRSPPTFS
jgi:hypothetical protein